MEIIIQLISLILLLSGIICYLFAYRHRTPVHPDLKKLNSYKPKNWIPFWKTKDWYDAKGFRLQIISLMLFVSGGLLSAFYRYFL